MIDSSQLVGGCHIVYRVLREERTGVILKKSLDDNFYLVVRWDKPHKGYEDTVHVSEIVDVVSTPGE